MARPTSSRIRPGIDLTQITIKLTPYQPPTVELTGRLATGHRALDQADTATIRTMGLDEVGVAFVSHMKAMFDRGP